MRRLSTLVVVVGALGSSLSAMTAYAFVYSGMARCCDTVFYRVEYNPIAPDPLVTCGDLPPAGWFRSLVGQGAARWNGEGTAFRLIDAGTTLTSCVPEAGTGLCLTVQDNQNTVSLAGSCSWVDNNILAFASSWYISAGPDAGCIFESDICFNATRTWYTGMGVCSGACFDVMAVATHEFGHFINAGHESDAFILGYSPIMYHNVGACQVRAMSDDDRSVLKWAYSANGAIAQPQRTVSRHLHPADAGYDTPPPRESCGPCACPCHANPDCVNPGITVTDVIHAIDVGFRGDPSVTDEGCPVARTDVNCSGATDVVDITRLINVAFRGHQASSEFCNPCS